ncbi:MAG TPA: hypothetical protein PKH79_01050 [Prolixibacteraceae bacterium]|nr:hypothetical protein [Prolixibacteraceae bacterium]HPS11952.1 hypothetical protein [Prolixibacteraceae bacterium]
MNAAYPWFPVSVITILAYFTTWLFTRWGIFTLKSHRKFWNYLLLVTFLISGMIGLVSVVKINYKLEIPNYDQLLRWHVSFGIGMVVIAIFHFSWHLRYYFSRSGKSSNVNLPGEAVALTEWLNINYLLMILGAVAIINQLVFIREFLSVLDGNELVMGLVMSGWMILTGWGAYFGRNCQVADFTPGKGLNQLIFLSFVPYILIGLLYWLKKMLFPPGTIAGLGISIVGIFLLLFPVCFLSGYLFTQFSACYSRSNHENRISSAYRYESIGSLAGGLLFASFLGKFFNSFQIFGLTTGIVFIVAAWMYWSRKSLERYLFLTVGIVFPLLIFLLNPDIHIKKLFYPNQEIISDQSTRYGNLVVTRQQGQLNFYENNSLQFYTDNMAQSEEAVHYAMVQREQPQQVLLISGGISGMINEIEKYPIKKITYLESNPEIFYQWKKLANVADFKNVEFVKSDIRTFLYQSKTVYDVVLINLPPPSTLGYNRFYTEEFFSLVKKHCNHLSVVCTSLPSTVNYPEENALEVNASLCRTLGTQFSNQLVLPGEKNYFLVSDESLSWNITELVTQKGIETTYVNSGYIDDKLLAERGQLLVSQFDRKVKVNHDFQPYMFLRQINHWFNFVGGNYVMLVAIPLLLFLALFFWFNPVTTGLYTGGFTSASLEVALMLIYQVYFGSLYLASAMFFSLFMGGLVVGSQWKFRQGNEFSLKRYSLVQFVLALFAVLLPGFVWLISKLSLPVFLLQLLFFIPVFLLAFAIGYEFNLASKLQPYGFSQTSGINYSADLVGSAFGAFLTAILLLPVCGLLFTCMAVAGLNLYSGLRVVFKK